MRSALLLAATAACGRVGFDPVAGDAGTSDAPFAPFTLPITGANSRGRALARTPDGGAIVVGSADGPVQVGGMSIANAGGLDALVIAVAPDGSVAWAHDFGTAGDDYGMSVAVGADGTVYAGGSFHGSLSFGGPTLTSNQDDGFLVSLDPAGNYRWARTLTGDQPDSAFGGDIVTTLAVLASGDVVAGGAVLGTVDFGDGVPVAPQGPAITEAYVAVYSADGASLRWARRWGLSNYNQTLGVGAGPNDTVYATGFFEGGPDFGGGAAPFQGLQDAFLVSLASDGTYRWSNQFGGPGRDWGYGVTTISDVAVVGGYFENTVDLPGSPASQGLQDGAVVAYSQQDGSVRWARTFGAAGCDDVKTIATGANDLLVGATYTSTIDLGTGPVTASDASDALVFTTSADNTLGAVITVPDIGDAQLYGIAGSRSEGVLATGFQGGQLDAQCGYAAGTGVILRLPPQ